MYEKIDKNLEEINSNVVNRNKIESTQSRFNITHMFIFISIGLIIGISMATYVAKQKSPKLHDKV